MHTMYEQPVGTFGVIRERYIATWHKNGFFDANLMILKRVTQVLLTPYYKITLGKRTFLFRGKKLNYFCHWYNTTFDNERMIEVAIALDLLASTKGKRVLEIGNVLSHYTDMPRDVLDKYEKGADIIHEDVVGYTPAEKYDLIISISTMEHVGFDEDPKDPEKFVEGMLNLQSMLKPDGRMFVTIPIAYNPDAVTAACTKGVCSSVLFYNRVKRMQWEESTEKEVLGKNFNKPYACANAALFCLHGSWNGKSL